MSKYQFPLYNFTGHSKAIHTVAFSPDGKILISGSMDMTIRIWNVENRELLKILHGHPKKTKYRNPNTILYMKFSPDGKYIISHDKDKKIYLWETESGVLLSKLSGHPRYVNFLKNDDIILTTIWEHDKVCTFWDMKTGIIIRKIQTRRASRRIQQVLLTSEGNILEYNYYDSQIHLQDGQTLEILHSFKKSGNSLVELEISPNDNLIAYNDGGSKVYILDLRTGKMIQVLEIEKMQGLNFSPNGKILATFANEICIWDVYTGQLIATLKKKFRVKNFEFISPNLIFILGFYGEFCYFDMGKGISVSSNNMLNKMKNEEDMDTIYTCACAAISPDGDILVTGSRNNALCLWNARSGEMLAYLGKKDCHINNIAINPDGTRIVSGGEDNIVRLWDVKTGKIVSQFIGHTHYITAVVFSYDNNIIASGSSDWMVRIWDVRTGNILHTLRHMESVRSIAISPNGKRIASCSPLFIRIWDMKTGDLIHTIQDNKDSWKLPSPIGFNDSRKNAIFSNDNKILRVQEKGNYSYWDVQSGSVVQWKKEDFLRSDSLQYDSPNRFQNISINHLGENILLSLVLPSDLSSKEKEIISHHIEFPRWINFEYFFQPSHLLSQAQLSKWQKKMRNLIH